MKTHITALFVALFAFAGGRGVLDSSAAAADLKLNSSIVTGTYQVPYYLIQVEYARPVSGYGGYGGYGGHYGYYPRFRYSWYTIAETTNLEEAEFIYALYELGYEEGVLDEIAPDLGYGSFPTRVRMITEYRDVQPTFTMAK